MELMFMCICSTFFSKTCSGNFTSLKEIAKEENKDDVVSENVSTSQLGCGGDEREGSVMH
jgi:hypothetical protein